MRALTHLLLAWLATTIVAQFVAPPDASEFTVVQGPVGIRIRYKQVKTGPGSICELHPNVTSYSGFVDIDEHEHYFFWFFGARNVNPEDAHLTAWISGGPGASSMSELFTEHGPCRIDERGNPTYNPYSWNTNSNMVYIDQPTTVGFSYTSAVPAYIDQNGCSIKPLSSNKCPAKLSNKENGCPQYGISRCGTFPDPVAKYTSNSTEVAAPKFWKALQGIYAAFPKYTQQKFTLASESYGGHYAPVFSREIAAMNANLPEGAHHIPQQSMQVNNGWYDPLIGYQAFYFFLVNPGNTYGIELPSKNAQEMNHSLYGKDECVDGLLKCNSPEGTNKICSYWDDYCTNHVQRHLKNNLGRDTYDIREVDPDPFPNDYYVNYLNTEPVQKELGVFTNYTDDSTLVGITFDSTGDDARELGIVQTMADLVDSGVSVTLLNGDSDYDCNWLGTQIVAEMVVNLTKTQGLCEAYHKAGFQNISTNDGIVHGQVKQAGRFSFVRVYESGHQVGFFQPLADQAIYNRTIAGTDIATGTQNVAQPVDGSIYRSHGTQQSTFYNGNRTVQYHKISPNAVYNYTSNEPTDNHGPGTSTNIGPAE